MQKCPVRPLGQAKVRLTLSLFSEIIIVRVCVWRASVEMPLLIITWGKMECMMLLSVILTCFPGQSLPHLALICSELIRHYVTLHIFLFILSVFSDPLQTINSTRAWISLYSQPLDLSLAHLGTRNMLLSEQILSTRTSTSKIEEIRTLV